MARRHTSLACSITVHWAENRRRRRSRSGSTPASAITRRHSDSAWSRRRRSRPRPAAGGTRAPWLGRPALHLAPEVGHREVVGGAGDADIGRGEREEHVRPPASRLPVGVAWHELALGRHEDVGELEGARHRATHPQWIPCAGDRDAVGVGVDDEEEGRRAVAAGVLGAHHRVPVGVAGERGEVLAARHPPTTRRPAGPIVVNSPCPIRHRPRVRRTAAPARRRPGGCRRRAPPCAPSWPRRSASSRSRSSTTSADHRHETECMLKVKAVAPQCRPSSAATRQ